jgi:hypothetical protein
MAALAVQLIAEPHVLVLAASVQDRGITVDTPPGEKSLLTLPVPM